MKKIRDDRSAFLKLEGSELLYWWQVVGKHQLIQFATVPLTDKNRVNCEITIIYNICKTCKSYATCTMPTLDTMSC